MSRRLLTILAFGCALLLTVGAWWQVMLYKVPPHGALALWLPFVVLLRAHDGLPILIALFQFPLLAVSVVLASRRFPLWIVLGVLLAFYALCCWGAVLMLQARLWINHALQRTALGSVVLFGLSFAGLSLSFLRWVPAMMRFQ